MPSVPGCILMLTNTAVMTALAHASICLQELRVWRAAKIAAYSNMVVKAAFVCQRQNERTAEVRSWMPGIASCYSKLLTSPDVTQTRQKKSPAQILSAALEEANMQHHE